ncbi:FecR domain-containing protein [soil metagenome]
MVRRFHLAPFAATLLLLCPVVVTASQPPATDAAINAPAHISLSEGVVTLERDGRVDDSPGSMPLLSGDRILTKAGRAEILFADGSTLHVDRDTTLDLQSDELVRLLEGRLRLSIPGPARSVNYRIDAPHAWLQIDEPGDYRVALVRNSNRDEFEAAVLRGTAALINEDGRTALRAGERAFARADAAPSYAYAFNSASWDAFDRWSEDRRNERLGLSAQYLPDEVRPYAGTLDRNGAWRYEASYGYVWYPRVDVSWRPYYQGRWTTLPSYGWTWIGSDPWGWPTHHYGRWGYSANAWFWIPGRSWAPAWVSWAYAPGYVSWCPLGWNNRPVFHLNAGYNVGRVYDPWRAWTVVPQRHFGSGYVHRGYVGAYQIDARTRGAFAYRDAPAIVGHAVPRATAAPIRVAGTGRARSSSPLLTNRDAGVRPGSDQGQTRVRPGSDQGQTGVRPGSERSQTGGRPGADPAQRQRTAAPQSNPRQLPQSDRSVAHERYQPQTTARPIQAPSPAPPRPEEFRAGTSYRPGERETRERTPAVPFQDPRVDRRMPERAPQSPAADRGEGGYERRSRSVARPASASTPPSAAPSRPELSGPPAAAAPPPSSRSRGDAPSRGTAVRRPGGGR